MFTVNQELQNSHEYIAYLEGCNASLTDIATMFFGMSNVGRYDLRVAFNTLKTIEEGVDYLLSAINEFKEFCTYNGTIDIKACLLEKILDDARCDIEDTEALQDTLCNIYVCGNFAASTYDCDSNTYECRQILYETFKKSNKVSSKAKFVFDNVF